MGVSSSRWASVVLAVVVVAAGLFEVHNLDIGLHARTGQWIVEHGEVPNLNVMSAIHADHPTVDDKWLFQVVTHWLWDGGGPDLVILARLLLMLALFAVMDSTARKLGADPGARLLMLLLALLAMRTRFMFRPGLVSLLLLATVMRTCLATRPDGRGAARLLVPLQLLWANVHGYFILGPVSVGAVAAGHLLRGRAGWPTARRFVLLSVGMAAVCLVNPAGLDGALHPVAILTDLREHYDFYSTHIVEFRGAFADDARQPFDRLGFYLLGGAAAVLFVSRAWIEWRGRRAEAAVSTPEGAPAVGGWSPSLTGPALVLLVLLTSQTFSLRRNMAPFAVVMGPLAAAAWTATVQGARGLPVWTRRLPGLALPTVLGVALLLGEVTDFTSVHDGLDRRAGLGRSVIAYPDVGIDFIAEHLPRAGVWTEFGYGSTFTGRRWPDQVAATDGNTHGYPTAWLRGVIEASSGQDPLVFDEVTRRHGLDVALIPMATPLALSLLHRDDWVLTCLGYEEAVFVRRTADLPDGPWQDGAEVPLDDWLARHDLVARLAAGDEPDWPSTSPPGTLAGLPRAVAPRAEIDQALVLLSLDLPALAARRAAAALALTPDDPQALGLAGLAAARLGHEVEARRLLQQSLDRGLAGSVQRVVRQALDRLR